VELEGVELMDKNRCVILRLTGEYSLATQTV
jgi:hypothetical protein